MTTELKLLTEADVRREFAATGAEPVIRFLRARGLIAEEPVDPVAHIMALVRRLAPDSEIEQAIRAIAAPRKELTRELVREAVNKSLETRLQAFEIDLLHAALTEALQ